MRSEKCHGPSHAGPRRPGCSVAALTRICGGQPSERVWWALAGPDLLARSPAAVQRTDGREARVTVVRPGRESPAAHEKAASCTRLAIGKSGRDCLKRAYLEVEPRTAG